MTTKNNNGDNGFTTDDLFKVVQNHGSVLGERFDVKELSILTWHGLDPETNGTRIDLMVDFNGRVNAKSFFGATAYLTDLLDREVYLCTEKGAKDGGHPYDKGQTILV